MKKYILLIVFILTSTVTYSQLQQNKFSGNGKFTKTIRSSSELNKYVDELIGQMTLAEKVGQLVQVVGPHKVSTDYIRDGKVGSFLLGTEGAERANSLQKIAVEESRLGIPLIFANDVIHGYNTIFPIPLAETSSWNPELVEKAAKIAAIEAAAEGTHWTFAPMVDIARDPRWGRIMEGSGEDPYLGSIMGVARVKGFQGESLEQKNTVAACAKHYVAYGGAEGGKDYNTVDISERTLREIYLPPFKSAIDAGVETIMSAFNDLNGVPASANHFVLTKVLRNEWDFKGFVVSDYNSVGELRYHGFAKDKKDAAEKGFTAGVDMDMVGDTIDGDVYSPYLEQLVNEGKVPIELIDKSVRNVLKLKYKLGLFNNPYVDTNYFNNNMPSKSERNRLARQISRESIVLLKNENKILPISKKIKSIALIGPLADNQQDLLGEWACDGKPENVITIKKGIENKLGNSVSINYVKGCEILDEEMDEFDAAIEAAKKSDVAILAVGEGRLMSGEAASRADLNLPGNQLELVKKIYETGTPTVVILLNGRPLTINWISEHVPAIIEGWYLGDQTGNAIADVLFGDYNPSGKLPVTFPRSVGQIPLYYSYKFTGRPPRDYKYTTKYLYEDITPLFPFGFGLSYTTFNYTDFRISSDTLYSDQDLKASITISNSGNVEGNEIVQLYIGDQVASVTRPIKELKGFKKIFLKPDESQTIDFKITSDDLSFYNIDLEKVTETGWFDVMIGPNSRDLQKKSFFLK